MAERRYGQDLATSIEVRHVGRVPPRVDLQELGDHAHIPQLDNTIGVTGGHGVTPQVEHGMVAGVLVAVEGLHTEAGSQIPQGDGLVPRGGQHVIREGLEGDEVHGVHVATEGLSAPHAGHVEGLHGLILGITVRKSRSEAGHGTRHHEIAQVMEGASPHGPQCCR